MRATALATLGGHRDSGSVAAIAARLRDPDRNVRVAAANALGAVGGAAGAQALTAAFDDQGEDWAIRQAALLALARVDTGAFAERARQWGRSTDKFDRQAALQGWALVRGADPAPFRAALRDSESALRAIALESWRQTAGRSDAALREAAGTAWLSDDPGLRAAALAILADSATDTSIDLLTNAWASRSLVLREAALDGLIRISRGERSFLTRLVTPARRPWFDRPAEATLRATAQRGFPSLAARWGPVWPVETGKSMQDYRELAGRYLLATNLPRVVIDVESRGQIELELFAREAPLTVANFLLLVDRGYFNGSRWHRVVPNFVIQDGDPTGFGDGGPGWSIRDEINRLRYDGTMVGMAHSGRDTGGSQWFINLSPQPHLNGGYTIFGRVSGGHNVVPRVLQGDRIRSISRASGP
ncbi:MAG TPA: peptidylprolyl isomerase [Gemmatimonadales bacterium]|nr:peptidylprolyl isomerase [Gemmatimonadales bacterium]